MTSKVYTAYILTIIINWASCLDVCSNQGPLFFKLGSNGSSAAWEQKLYQNSCDEIFNIFISDIPKRIVPANRLLGRFFISTVLLINNVECLFEYSSILSMSEQFTVCVFISTKKSYVRIMFDFALIQLAPRIHFYWALYKHN